MCGGDAARADRAGRSVSGRPPRSRSASRRSAAVEVAQAMPRVAVVAGVAEQADGAAGEVEMDRAEPAQPVVDADGQPREEVLAAGMGGPVVAGEAGAAVEQRRGA